MTNPIRNDGSPADQGVQSSQPARNLAPVVTRTVDAARQLLPQMTLEMPRNLSQLEPLASLSCLHTTPASLHARPATAKPAPEISKKPASEQIIQMLQTSVEQKKNVLSEPGWYYEYLERHLEDFQDADTLKRLFHSLRLAVDHGYLSTPNEKECAILSQLVCRLCAYADNSDDFILAYVNMIILLWKFQQASVDPILSPAAFQRFLAALERMPAFQHSFPSVQAALFNLVRYTKTMPIHWENNLVNCLAGVLVGYYRRGFRLRNDMLSSHIPGFINSLLSQGNFPDEKCCLELCQLWSFPGQNITSSAQEQLHTLLEQIAESIGRSIAQEDKIPNGIPRYEFKNTTRAEIVSAIHNYATIVSHAQLIPLALKEITVLAQLVRHLCDVSPISRDIDHVLSSLSILYHPHHRSDLKPLETAIIHLLTIAVSNYDLHCVCRHSATYKFMTVVDQKTSDICPQVFEELLTCLQNVISVSSDFLDSERIAKACYIAGLLADFPVKIDCRDVVMRALSALAVRLMPSQDVTSCSLDELIAKLLSHYLSLETDRNWIKEVVPELLSGLGMLVSNQVMNCFPESDKGYTFRELDNRFIEVILDGEWQIHDPEFVEVLFWMGSMSEMCDKSPSLDPLLDGQEFQCADTLLKSLGNVSEETAGILISGVGKLVVHNRLRKLSLEGKNALRQLIKFYFDSEVQVEFLDYSKFLFILSHFYLKGLIGIECKHLQISFYRPFLLRKLQECPPSNVEQLSEILFFIDAVQPLQGENDCGTVEEKAKFAACIQEMKERMEQYLLSSRRDGNKIFVPRKRQKK